MIQRALDRMGPLEHGDCGLRKRPFLRRYSRSAEAVRSLDGEAKQTVQRRVETALTAVQPRCGQTPKVCSGSFADIPKATDVALPLEADIGGFYVT